MTSETPSATTEEMVLETATPATDKESVGKREREEVEVEAEEEVGGDGNGVVTKKQKVDDEDKEKENGKENGGAVVLGPKSFVTSVEMFDYFYKLLHLWPLNVPVNQYEYMVLLDLITKGHPEPEKKIGLGVDAFEIRHHPIYSSRCFFVVRSDKSAEDFSFRKSIDHILPLPENIKIKPAGNGGGKRGGGGGGGRGGRGGRGRGNWSKR